MPEYRRAKITGATYFFTVVTYKRKPLFADEICRQFLHNAWLDVSNRFPFATDAICLLPDHLHCIWTLPEGDDRYSIRWGEIKRLFSKKFLAEHGNHQHVNESRDKRGEAAVWQRRFWEHMIRNEDDLRRHLDYIHYNPVKHVLANQVKNWEWSSFHRYVKEGFYTEDWAVSDKHLIDNKYFGD